MSKKTRPLIIIIIFLLAIIMPFVKVDAAVVQTIDILNPGSHDSFSYFTTDQVFRGYSITTGLTGDTSYDYTYFWYINAVLIDNGNSDETTSGAGVLYLTGSEFDTTVDISSYAVGEHNTTLYVKIIDTPIHEKTHTHDWSRDSPPPSPSPVVTFTTPSVSGTGYNYSSVTSYTCGWDIADGDDNIATMNIYLDDVLEDDWSNPPEGDYSEVLTIDTEKVYVIKVNGTDDLLNEYSETTYLIAYITGQYLSIIDPDGQYHNSEIDFEITSGAPNGLHNMSYSVEDYGWFDSNDIVEYSNESLLGGVTYGYSLNWSDYIDSVSFDYGAKYKTKTDWYNVAWDYRLLLNISSTDIQTDYAMTVDIVVADSVYDDDKANGDDWVVTEDDGTTVCDHWLERYDSTGTSELWFITDLASGYNSFYLYYGNAAASNSEDASGVFVYWDGFEDYTTGNTPTGWTVTGDEYGDIETSEAQESHGSKSCVIDDTSSDGYMFGHNGLLGVDLISDYYFSYWAYTSDNDKEGVVLYTDTFDGFEGGNTYLAYDTAGKLQYYDGAMKDLGTLTAATWFQVVVYFTDTSTYNQYFYDLAGTLTDSAVGIDYRDTPTSIEYLQFAGHSATELSTWYVDSLKVWDKVTNTPTYTKGNQMDEWVEDAALEVTETPDATGISTLGDVYNVTLSTAVASKVTFNITYTINETVFIVYSISANTVQTNSFTLDATVWASLSEDWFNMNVSLFDDVGSFYSLNLTYFKDITSPIVTLRSPENRTASDPYSNLQIIPLDYDIEDDNPEVFTNDMKTLLIDGEIMNWDQYPKHKPLIFYQGLHTLNITVEDWAGNKDTASVSFYYEARLDKPLTLTFTSSLDNETIDPEQYLNIYIDGMPISATTTTNLNNFTITVYDKFGILLNSTSFDYEATIDILVPLRPVVFENNNDIFCEYKITYGLFEKSFWIQADTNQTYYLNDTTYILVAEPGEEYFNETHWYGQTYISFTVESGMSEIEVTLDLISDDPLHNPLIITLYDKDLDTDMGFVYVIYETSWGNTTIRVMDNTTWLGSAKGEGITIWIFDTTVYGMHNITIYINNSATIVFTDVLSFYLEEPAPVDNYYLSVTTSVDANGGLLYITVNTFWDNCTIRVFDNEVPLGGNTSEGNSIWSFDESVYGLHNFTIEVYQGNDLWDTIYTSVTIMAPDAETNYYLTIDTSIDVDGGLFYVTINTYFGNCTIGVEDNTVSLGNNVTEGASIWQFNEDVYGLHNFSIFVYQGNSLWDTIYTSITIVEPSAESNYYLTIGTSIDAGSGLLYVTIETYFGNCTVRVMDNSTWLGDNVTEGSSIWTFSTTYGLHSFNISIYQGNDLWNMIYTSITIVEPDVEVLALTLYDKAIDADAGLIYINYETNWGNTTIRVKDNTTWIGDMTSGEENSIWTFTTDYGLHNITVIIYNDGVPWFTDIFSFTIIVPYQIWKELTFTFTSTYDSAIIPAYDYLDVYLNEDTMFISASNGMGMVLYDIFNISVYDRFGQLLYEEANRLYEETISINLPMRPVNFTNPNSVVCYYRLSLGIYERAFWITQTQTIGYYMLDGNYTIVAEPTTLDAGNGYEYVLTAASFEVVAGMSDIGVTLLTQQITIIYRPITIRATSQYTSAAISEWYLKYYLDGILSMEGATTETANLTIQLVVTDVFGNILYNQSVAYSRYVDIIVPLRSCMFRNKETTSTTLTITQEGSEEHLFFMIGVSSYIKVYLADATYNLVHAPTSPDKGDGVMYVAETYTFTCSLSSQSIDLWLGEFEVMPPLLDPYPIHNRWAILAAVGMGSLNFIGLVFAVGVIITRLPKKEEKEF